MTTEIKLVRDAYLTGSYYRLPTEDGKPSVYVMEGSWYQAEGEDASGNEYTVFWAILPDWDGEDEGDACDWEHPVAIVREDPWADVTAHATVAL